MINLAGNKLADSIIQEELYLARIFTTSEVSEGEVPYNIIGKTNHWSIRRAWCYYIATLDYPACLGLPLLRAIKLHEKDYPIKTPEYQTLGQVIRAQGDCTSPHPKDLRYPTINDIEEEFIQTRKKYPKINFDSSKAFNQATLRELNGIKYVRLYHIDTQIGLNAFADAVRGTI